MKNKKLISAILAATMVGQVGVCAVPAMALDWGTSTSATSLLTASKIALKEDASITYNADAATMKQSLFDNLIDLDNSTLPEDISVDDLTFTYDGITPIEGISGIGKMGAGTHEITVTYAGKIDLTAGSYSSAVAIGAVTVNKATMSIKVKTIGSIYFDESVPDDYVTVTPANDNIAVFTVYAGVNTDLSIGAWVQFPDEMTSAITLLDKAGFKYNGKTLTQIMQDGVTLGQFIDLFSSFSEYASILSSVGIDMTSITSLIDTVSNLPDVVKNTTIGFGTPNKAGLYAVVAVGASTNYETGYGIGSLVVKMRLTGNNLTWTEEASTITEEQAANMDLGAQLSRDGDVTISQKNVKVRYFGYTDAGSLYSSTTAPTAAGKYLETAMTVGGNYFATPIVRNFTITAS